MPTTTKRRTKDIDLPLPPGAKRDPRLQTGMQRLRESWRTLRDLNTPKPKTGAYRQTERAPSGGRYSTTKGGQ
jgi:hypothetical protein